MIMNPLPPTADPATFIERLVNGGVGLARIEGRPVFIPGVCPGEEVRASIIKVKKDYSEGKLEEVIRPSPDRVSPPCPVAGTCGGCQWQHLDYPAQIRAKEEILREDLLRIGKISEPNILPTIPSDDPFGYRTRIQLKVKVNKSSQETGFFASNSNRIIPIDFCPVTRDPLNRFLDVWNKILRTRSEPLPPVKEIHLNLASSTGEIQASYFLEDEFPEKLQKILSDMRREIPKLVSQIITTRRGKRRIRGRDYLNDRFSGFNFRISDRSFAQVHAELRDCLIQTVLVFSRPATEEKVLELYCGIGTFSLSLAGKTRSVLGIDENRIAVGDARANAKNNRIANVRYMAKPVKSAIDALVKKSETFDLVVLDPPRGGVGRIAIESIRKLSPKRIVYVSCSSSTLARDSKTLVACGFKPQRFQPIDLFPQTHHLETVVEFTLT